ncbi:hypothetical protein DVK00_02780 [Haloarcula sp. Atlit-47R]|uniref:hypothetical protein n=1 Tax=Haloarcula sp. Atlit-47R TaxID=2282132 RepID=UPI000EF28893|nr:hypothetical protein [Haloarcula sp. Atlit-47R]RLM47449.1 hypothetical protein DVK00_02780 [Haloarcula sp. Atlit-47R]
MADKSNITLTVNGGDKIELDYYEQMVVGALAVADDTPVETGDVRQYGADYWNDRPSSKTVRRRMDRLQDRGIARTWQLDEHPTVEGREPPRVVDVDRLGESIIEQYGDVLPGESEPVVDRVRSVEQKLSEVQTELQAFENEDLPEKVADAQDELAGVRDDVDGLEKRMSRIEEELNRLDSARQDHGEALDRHESQIDKLFRGKSKLGKELKTVQEDVEGLEKDVERHQSRLDSWTEWSKDEHTEADMGRVMDVMEGQFRDERSQKEFEQDGLFSRFR